MRKHTDAIIIGAGVAGLAAARTFAAAGRRVVVLERSRGVGGRCATRRIEGQPVDHGVAFLHGRDPGFLAELEAVPTQGRLEGWPLRVDGRGNPCQPAAFDPEARRMAFAEGVTVFPKYLARGLEVRLKHTVRALAPGKAGITVTLETGETLAARTLVLGLAVEQSVALLRSLDDGSRDLNSVRELLAGIGSLPCLTLIAGYERGVPDPEWDVNYPEDSPILQMVIHDSAKRPEPRDRVMVYQALPRWSGSHLAETPESWSRSLLDEAANRLGGWAGEPRWIQPHRWRYARTDAGSALARSLVVAMEGGTRIGLAGDIFAPHTGGVESAWISSRQVADRLMNEGAS